MQCFQCESSSLVKLLILLVLRVIWYNDFHAQCLLLMKVMHHHHPRLVLFSLPCLLLGLSIDVILHSYQELRRWLTYVLSPVFFLVLKAWEM